MQGGQVFEIDWGITMEAEVDEDCHFLGNAGGYVEPLESLNNSGDVFMFADFHKHPGSSVLE